MEDFPAGPASPEPRRPALSVVIPVRDGGEDFEHCLRRLRDSSFRDFEIIVVDDGSTDDSARRAAAHGARVLTHETPLGPAAARNLGAKSAKGSIVFFLDADVAVHPDTLSKAHARFEADPELAALFGSYDDRPTAPGVVSRYRNLLHHYVHQTGRFENEARPAHTFWTGCGAIRKDLFLAVGGFDPERYRRPAIEDIELGYRVVRAGGKILLVRDMLATHLKRWTLRDIIRTDIMRRGVPWMLLIRRTRQSETDLNVSISQRVSVMAAGAGALGLAGSALHPAAALGWVGSLVLIGVLNRGFHAFLLRNRGVAFAAAGFWLHYLYFWCCGLSVGIALAIWHLQDKHAAAPLPGLRLDPPEPRPARRPWRTPAWTRRIRRSSPSFDRTAAAKPSTRRSL